LPRQGAFDGTDHRAELDQHTVAGRLGDTTAMLRNKWISSDAMLAQRPRGARLVFAH